MPHLRMLLDSRFRGNDGRREEVTELVHDGQWAEFLDAPLRGDDGRREVSTVDCKDRNEYGGFLKVPMGGMA